MNQHLTLMSLVRAKSVMSEPERRRRKELRIRHELGKLFDTWGLAEVVDGSRLGVWGCAEALRAAWVGYVYTGTRQKQHVGGCLDLCVRSVPIAGMIRPFGVQLLQALHPGLAFYATNQYCAGATFRAVLDDSHTYMMNAATYTLCMTRTL